MRLDGGPSDFRVFSLCSFCFDSLRDRQTPASGLCRQEVTFACWTIKSMSEYSISVSYIRSTAASQKKLQKEIRSAEKQSLSLPLPASPALSPQSEGYYSRSLPSQTYPLGRLSAARGHKMQWKLLCHSDDRAVHSVISHCCFSDLGIKPEKNPARLRHVTRFYAQNLLF